MKTVPLGKLTSLVSSGSTPLGGASVYLDDGPVMLVRSQNVLMRELNLHDVAFITEEIAKGMKRTIVFRNDVLLNITGASIGRVSTFEIENVKANVNQHVCIIRPIPELLDHRYLMHFIAQPRFQNQINSTQHGGTRQALTFSQIRNFQIPLPTLAEQRRIAAILDKADAIRRKRKQAIQHTEELLRATFLDMFGDPVTNPKDWKVVELRETFARNPQIGTTKPAHRAGEQLIIRVGEVGSKNVQLENCGRITLEGSDLQKNLCAPGDFFLVRAIGSESHLGKASILQNTNEIVVFDSHVMRLRFSFNKLLPEFFLEWLKTKGGRCRFMKEAGRTAVQFNVNAKQISRMQIPLPPLSLQKQFVKLYKQFGVSREQTDNSAQTMDVLFDSLLQRAFRGEL